MRSHQEVRGAHAPYLVDATVAALGQGSFVEQLLPGLDSWRRRLDASLGVGLLGHEGLTVGDFDGDGLEDLYVCQPGGLPNRLFLARPDGSAREAAAEAGLDWLDMTRAALLVELDGRAGRDLVLALGDEVLLLANDGAGRFEPRLGFEAPTTTSLAAADVDGDGDLDLYACGYVTPYDDQAAPLPYHDANNGQPNLFLRNDGDWRFVDATRASGLDANNRRFSFAASFEDYDDDGDPDLYVANDFGRNNLYRNDGGTFVDVAAEAGVEDVSAGMGVTWADYDGDGLTDLYVSNMFSSAGSRVTYQRRFQSGADARVLGELRRHARGNSLFRNRGDGTFEDVSVEAGVTMGRWAWGASFVELNADGRPDLLVPNGFVTGERPHDL